MPGRAIPALARITIFATHTALWQNPLWLNTPPQPDRAAYDRRSLRPPTPTPAASTSASGSKGGLPRLTGERIATVEIIHRAPQQPGGVKERQKASDWRIQAKTHAQQLRELQRAPARTRPRA